MNNGNTNAAKDWYLFSTYIIMMRMCAAKSQPVRQGTGWWNFWYQPCSEPQGQWWGVHMLKRAASTLLYCYLCRPTDRIANKRITGAFIISEENVMMHYSRRKKYKKSCSCEESSPTCQLQFKAVIVNSVIISLIFHTATTWWPRKL